MRSPLNFRYINDSVFLRDLVCRQRRAAAAPEITPYALWPVEGKRPDLKVNAVSAVKNEVCLAVDGQLEAISLIYLFSKQKEESFHSGPVTLSNLYFGFE
jgi:hypothetical protein